MDEFFAQWFAHSDSIIEELLTDGSDPDAIYTIEHHFASPDFDALEKAAVNCFKAGFDVTDAEEIEQEDGQLVLSFDVILEMPLDGEQIKADIRELAEVIDHDKVFYDGWGTYFEDGEDEE